MTTKSAVYCILVKVMSLLNMSLKVHLGSFLESELGQK